MGLRDQINNYRGVRAGNSPTPAPLTPERVAYANKRIKRLKAKRKRAEDDQFACNDKAEAERCKKVQRSCTAAIRRWEAILAKGDLVSNAEAQTVK